MTGISAAMKLALPAPRIAGQLLKQSPSLAGKSFCSMGEAHPKRS